MLDEILRLQSVLIEDTRFVPAGLRPDSVFLGECDQNRRDHEFKALRDDEVALIEGIVRDAFDGFKGKPAT